MFNASDPVSPSLLASGDRVGWQAIDRPVYLGMEAAARAGRLDRDSLLLPSGDH
jgi:hypothetical protein